MNIMENEENNIVYHNPDGSVFEGTVDHDTMGIVPEYHTDDGRTLQNVVVPVKAKPPL